MNGNMLLTGEEKMGVGGMGDEIRQVIFFMCALKYDRSLTILCCLLHSVHGHFSGVLQINKLNKFDKIKLFRKCQIVRIANK